MHKFKFIGFSLIHTGSKLYIQAQIDTCSHLNLLISIAQGSTMSFDFLLGIIIEHNWEFLFAGVKR